MRPASPHPPLAPAAPVGIIAGRGALPRHLAEAAARAGRRVTVASFAPLGWQENAPSDVHFIPARFEALGALFDALRMRGVGDLFLAGALERPTLDPAAFDSGFRRHAPQLLAAMGGGDDGLLRAVIAMLESEGFRVRGPWELAPDLLPPPGVLTKAVPGDADKADAARAAVIQQAIGRADIGQSCVVAGGLCLGVETIEGTDALLERVRTDPVLRARRPKTPRGLFFKAPKPGQELRVDMPAIGPETVVRAARAGLGGIVIEAGGVLVLEAEATVAAADAAGLFLWVRPGPEGLAP